MIRPWLIALGLAATLTAPLAAQEKAAGKAPGKTAAKGDSPNAEDEGKDPAVAEFDKIFAEWKELLAKLEDLRARYIATPRKGPERGEIKKEYDELVRQGEKLEPKLIESATAAFAAVGNERPEIGKYLAAKLKDDVEHDNYEPAVAIARSLIENNYDNPRIYNYGGLAAFCTNDLDDAEKWLTEGDKHAVLDVDAKQYLSHLPQYKELWETERKLREAESKNDDLPRVSLKTTKGDIVIELFENEAPNTVANFIHLVEKKFYDGVKFHRVLPHFMAQGGDPSGDGRGGPGYTIPDETDKSDYRNHFRGSLSMANTGSPNTGGSQFFLMFRPSGPGAGYNLNGKHTVFGRVIDGFDVLAKIQRIDPEKPEGQKPDKIVDATVLRKRKHAYVPKKIGDKDEKAGKQE